MNLFKIGDFQVTMTHLIVAFVAIILIIAVIAYRYNHRKQTKVSQYMDNECLIYNKKGIVKFMDKKAKKFNNPTVVVVEIRNLSYLYMNYSKRNKLMYEIANHLTSGLSKIETISRIEFDKFLIIFDDRDKEKVKEQCVILEERLDKMTIDDYGMYDFYVYYGIYENAPLDDPDLIYIAPAITKLSRLVENNNQYFYTNDVREIFNKLKAVNYAKDIDLEQNRFVPYIQPRVDITTGKVVGGEILCRWTSEQGFKYSPEEFVPLFENVGFMRIIDELMLKSACELATRLVGQGKSDIKIGVNISKNILMTSDFDTKLMEILTQYGTSSKNIELEITEKTYMENPVEVANKVLKLHQLGFSIAMDNFGENRSSFEHLTSKVFDSVKVDPLFFQNRLSTDKDVALIKNIIKILTKLDYQIVCVGVGDRQTLETLAGISRDYTVQGFVISGAIPLPQFGAFVGTVLDLKLPSFVEESKNISIETNVTGMPNGGTSINITGLGTNNDHSKELEDMRRQMDEMRHQFELSLEEQKRLAHEEELKRMKEQMERMQKEPQPQIIKQDNEEIRQLRDEIERLKNQKNPSNYEIDALKLEIERLKLNQNNTSTTYVQREYHNGYYDDEVSRLRREIDDLRYSSRDRRYYDDRYSIHITNDRDKEIELLQKQIDDLKEEQKNNVKSYNVEELISRLSRTHDNSKYEALRAQEEAKSLRERLDQEKKEREELEALISDLKTSKAQVEKKLNEAEALRAQEEANKRLNLDLSTLAENDFDDYDDEDEEDDEKISKPTLSLEELEAIIQSYRDKYNDEWNQHAKEELQDGYYEIVDGLNYYKKARQTFIEKFANMSDDVKQIYNIVKNELMKYKGISNRMTNYYDCFYLGRKQIAKLSLTSKKIKVYLAADPSKYPERQFPHKDVSAKKAHVRTPYYTMIKSQLSVKRINKVIADVMDEANVIVNDSYEPVDYATKIKLEN